jgi:glycosyltransferase involved in cell wall biosynthesis
MENGSNNNQSKKIFCIIPAYNEESNIVRVLRDILPLVHQTIVIDDSSTDKTWEELNNFVSENNFGELTILRHAINRGQGAALQTGNEYALKAGADIIVHFDADGQFLANEIKNLTDLIETGKADVVLGSRFLGIKSNIPWQKEKIIFPLARLVNRIFLGIQLTDPQSGFRAMSREAVLKIEIKQDRMAHCSEILHKIFKNNLNTKEVPITVIYHNFGQKFSGGIKIFRDILLSKLID